MGIKLALLACAVVGVPVNATLDCPYRNGYDENETILVASNTICASQGGKMLPVCLIDRDCTVVGRFSSTNTSFPSANSTFSSFNISSLVVGSGIRAIGDLSDYPDNLPLRVSDCSNRFTLKNAIFPPQLVNITISNCYVSYTDFNAIIWPNSSMTLTLNYCNISNQHFNFPPNVVELNLVKNKLDMIPPEVAHRPNLRTLDVSWNYIGAITSINLSSLSSLTLDFNNLQAIQNVHFSDRLDYLSAKYITLSRFEVNNDTYDVLEWLYYHGSLVLETEYTLSGRSQCELAQGHMTTLGSNMSVCVLPSYVENVPDEVFAEEKTNYVQIILWVIACLVIVVLVAAVYVIRRRRVAESRLPTKDTWDYMM
ncbi:hypothetical protein LEN26_007785 [Aphanomyces euteiches]|nr:hypothetical protein AeMF1_019427 [Aphanomyces euteiches]KAH9131272.1 hypothetical protein LEN26_007785 [Aphanomyces euteiches]KAH9194640.1 hypothetical protein AeNC1_003376 [Aphanomyces euteiches]